MNSALLEELKSKSEPSYADFTAKLNPAVPRARILGVRAPEMDRIAKRMAKDGSYLTFLREEHYYFEEFSLHGALLGYVKFDSVDELVDEVERFLPFIDNWAICDGTASGLKAVKKHPELFYSLCRKWLLSDHTYTVRFGIVVLLSYFLDDLFRPEILDEVLAVRSEEYYVNIALAWFYSFALIKQYDATLPIFVGQRIDDIWVHNRSIRKALESYRIPEDRKIFLKRLRR